MGDARRGSGEGGGAAGRDDFVVFDVGGQHFKVLPSVILGKPSTLLASVLDDIGTDGGRPIFVDANPHRFPYILDWYRYGEMYVPADCPVDAVVRDARYFMLPDLVTINGRAHALSGSTAKEADDVLRRAVICHWPSFRAFVQRLDADAKASIDRVALGSVKPQEPCVPPGLRGTPFYLDPYSLLMASFEPRRTQMHLDVELAELVKVQPSTPPPQQPHAFPFVMTPVPGESLRWLDEENVCNELRLRVLKAELELMGFRCSLWKSPEDPKQVASQWSLPTAQQGSAPATYTADADAPEAPLDRDEPVKVILRLEFDIQL